MNNFGLFMSNFILFKTSRITAVGTTKSRISENSKASFRLDVAKTLRGRNPSGKYLWLV